MTIAVGEAIENSQVASVTHDEVQQCIETTTTDLDAIGQGMKIFTITV